MRKSIFMLPVLLLLSGSLGAKVKISNHTSFETRHFVFDRNQHPINHSETFETEFDIEYKNNNWQFSVKPRFAVDAVNIDRLRYIPNEAVIHFGDNWGFIEAGLLIHKWGNSPLYNPLDVLNRHDLEFNFFEAPALSELSLHLRKFFGERTFFDFVIEPLFIKTPLPELNTRFNIQGRAGFIPFSLDDQISALGNSKEVSIGVSLKQEFDPLNLTLYYFHGPDKTPGFQLTIDNTGALRLTPFYYVIDMLGSSIAANLGQWHLNLDVAAKITKSNGPFAHVVAYEDGFALPKSYLQYVPSFDRTFTGLMGNTDLTIMGAYYGDTEGASLKNFRPFQNDLFASIRADFNDTHQNTLNLGLTKDLSNTELAIMAEWQMRLYRELKIAAGGIYVHQAQNLNTPISFFDNNSQVYTKISYSF